MTELKILTVTAGLSEPSTTTLLGDQLIEATRSALNGAGVSAEFASARLRDLATAITDHYLTGFPTGALAATLDMVPEADAIIAVSPTFKASYTGLFKSFWDLVDDQSLIGTPVLVAATGGTARHSLMVDTAMRPLFGYFKAQVVPTGVFAATDDFGADTTLASRINTAGAQLGQMLRSRIIAGADTAPVATPTPENLHEANSGQFFGATAGEQRHKAPGLKPLTVTPFEELLNS